MYPSFSYVPILGILQNMTVTRMLCSNMATGHVLFAVLATKTYIG